MSAVQANAQLLSGETRLQTNTTRLDTPKGLDSVVPADEAFRLQTLLMADGKILLNWEIMPGHYLYRQSIGVVDDETGKEALLQLPEATQHTDEFFGATEVYYNQLSSTVSLPALETDSSGNVRITISYQGCAEDLYCYPPVQKSFSLALP